MVKAAYNSISTGLSTENPRAPPMEDFATQTARAPKGGWPELALPPPCARGQGASAPTAGQGLWVLVWLKSRSPPP